MKSALIYSITTGDTFFCYANILQSCDGPIRAEDWNKLMLGNCFLDEILNSLLWCMSSPFQCKASLGQYMSPFTNYNISWS